MRKPEDILINGKRLSEIIEKHRMWLYDEKGGERADLSYADLSSANLRSADLRSANLSSADLSSADLRSADLRSANLRSANLSSADLSSADLRSADLSSADLRSANLSSANLRYADLRYADLRSADLSSAENLDDIYYNEGTAFFAMACPEEGGFTAWKKLRQGKIAKLYIPTDAYRSSATTRKCRASKAKVLAIYDGEEEVQTGRSQHDSSFSYTVGEYVEVNDFDMDRWNECSTGIHFFITRKEAEQY